MSDPTSSPTPSAMRRWPAWVAVVAMATVPFVAMLAGNVGEGLLLGQVAAWWLATVVVATALVTLAFRAGRAAGRRAAVVVTVALWLFFNYPAITSLQETLGAALAAAAWWGLVTAVVLAVAAWASGRPPVQLFVAIAAPALLVLPLVQLAGTAPAGAADPASDPVDAAEQVVTLRRTPNVYYFVLDGHGGPDLLRERTDYDPEPFLAALREEGFDVASRATSNYPFTHLSVSAAMDMDYVYEGRAEPNGGPYFERLQGNNRTVDILLANGYSYVHAFPNFWGGSRCSGREDLCIGEHGPLSDTQWAMAAMTPLVELVADEEAATAVATTNDPLHVVERILARPPESPMFVFSHLLNPHPPLLRDGQCRMREVEMRLSAWGEGPEYGDAVACLHQRLEAAIDRILEVDEDPVIVIQGDHGPRFGIDWSVEGGVTLDQEMHFSILSAVRLPSECGDLDVPDDITPVNTFRLVFACLADTPPDLLPNRRFPIERR